MIDQDTLSHCVPDPATQISHHPPEPSFNILILTTPLPIFPGGGGVEYLTTKHMASLADQVGLVSMAHTRDDLNKAQGLVEAGVQLYLWHSPHLDAPPQPSGHSALVRTLHRWLEKLVDVYQA